MLNTPYYAEIINFMRTITLKFKPFAAIIGKAYMDQKGWTSLPDEQNPYYLHLAGEYVDTDTVITVVSVDTQEEIVFDKRIRIEHPKTYAAYKAPSNEYLQLTRAYPEMLDFINAVLYSEHDVHSIINLEDVALLSYDASLLCANEVDSLLYRLTSFMDACVNRWYINTFETEDLYPHVFYGMMWTLMPLYLHDQRIQNMHTNNVHDFHIWEFLTSIGLKDYRSILTRDQAIFLYRNIRYLLRNQGKHTNLQILADNLLKNLQVELVGLTIMENNTYGPQDCRMTPELINETINSDESSYSFFDDTFSTIGDLYSRLYTEGLDEEKTIEETVTDIETYGEVEQTKFITKFVELKQVPIDTQYENLMIAFCLDTLLYRVSKGLTEFTIAVTEPNTGISVRFSLMEAIAMLEYSLFKRVGETDIEMPTQAYLWLPWYTSKPTFDKRFTLYETKQRVDTWIDFEEFEDSLVFNSSTITDASENMSLIEDQFTVLKRDIARSRGTASTPVVQTYRYLYDQLTDDGMVNLPSVVEDNLYTTWFGTRLDVGELVEAMNASSNYKEMYDDFATILLEAILPYSLDFISKYADVSELSKEHYRKLKALFVQLCSYNIAFLDTTRVPKSYAIFQQVMFHKRDSLVDKEELFKLFDISYTWYTTTTNNGTYTVDVHMGDDVSRGVDSVSHCDMLMEFDTSDKSTKEITILTDVAVSSTTEHAITRSIGQPNPIAPECVFSEI